MRYWWIVCAWALAVGACVEDFNPVLPDALAGDVLDGGREVSADDGADAGDAPSDAGADDARIDNTLGDTPDGVDGTGCGACVAGEGCCEGRCVALSGDPAHCGRCGNACPAAPNAAPVCEEGACVHYCRAGFGDCDGDARNGCEADTVASAANCGACGRACVPAANETAACEGGRCVRACRAGYGDCDGLAVNGCETQTTTANNCGGCGVACPSRPHALGSCGATGCGIACSEGHADCDGDAVNGCEADVRSSTAHCGGCRRPCEPTNARGACAAGSCVVTTCTPGYGDCDGNPANGCEVDVRNDAARCGACGRVCSLPNATAACRAGSCVVTTCTPGYGDCDGNPANGCEVDLRVNAAHCGACGGACVPANAAPVCSGGACGYATCRTGFGDCDGDRANGCEVNLQGTVAHCGRCGMRCTAAGATPACDRGVCGIERCAAGLRDCDGAAGNGCEVNLDTDARNCGACGVACVVANGTPTCASGRCAVASCTSGFVDCNRVATDGCEVDVSANTAHCGGCGRACNLPNATAACRAGACAVAACAVGFADCDGSPTNGCEVDTRVTAAHCGVCGRGCALPNAVAECRAGVCAVNRCGDGFGDCDGLLANGCEVDLRGNPSHCGVCGNACRGPVAPAVCVGTAGCQCGNRMTEPPEQCDLGSGNNDMPTSDCRTDCRLCGSCGDGSEGAFAPAANTTLAGGTHNFESVRIPEGVTVTVTGREPLVLRVRGPVQIDGVLDLSGSPGAVGQPEVCLTCGDSGCTMATGVAAGGAGRGGGGAGGAGGGTSCVPIVGGLTGEGLGAGVGAPVGTAGGGGGGAGHRTAGANGQSRVCLGSQSRNCPRSGFGSGDGGAGGGAYGGDEWTALRPGSGGGGGGYGGRINGGGGGGGGGGGMALITAAVIHISGRISADGGAGGANPRTFDGGGGGGGSGGAVGLRAYEVVVTGTISTRGGGGGAAWACDCSAGQEGIGGNGADGRIRIEATMATLTGATLVPATTPVLLTRCRPDGC